MSYTKEDHIAMIKDPERWPLFPFLPMKHRTEKEGQWPVHGFIVKFYPKRVYRRSIHEMAEGASLDGMPRDEYESIAALAEDWEVD